jgi:hypothetical protein
MYSSVGKIFKVAILKSYAKKFLAVGGNFTSIRGRNTSS